MAVTTILLTSNLTYLMPSSLTPPRPLSTIPYHSVSLSWSPQRLSLLYHSTERFQNFTPCLLYTTLLLILETLSCTSLEIDCLSYLHAAFPFCHMFINCFCE